MRDLSWTDLSIGMRTEFNVELTAQMFADFAGLSGDRNPLHVDDDFARRAGFPSRVAFGMLTSSFFSQLAGMHLPGARCLLHGIDLEFKAPAFIGDVLTVSGDVTFLNEAYHRIEMKGQIRNQHGALITRATIRAGLNE